MDVALFSSDSSKPQLAAGVAAKLIDAAAANGPLVVPTSTGAVAGQQFRMLAGLAGLDATESLVLTGWLEDAYGPSIAERYARELPNVNVSQALTSLTVWNPKGGSSGHFLNDFWRRMESLSSHLLSCTAAGASRTASLTRAP